MARALKVFRTPIGFHDAYVAAPSRKAALEAWGTNRNLFARGAAEQVTDPDLMREPMAAPGVVVRRLRGTDAEQLAAVSAIARTPRRTADAADAPARPRKRSRPSRSRLDAVEGRVSTLEAAHRAQRQAIEEREAALREERRSLERTQTLEMTKAVAARDKAADAYRTALARWEG